MSDYKPDKKVIITASGAKAVRQLAVDGVLPFATRLQWERDGADIHVEDTGEFATIEIGRTLFEELDRRYAWLISLSEAFKQADTQLSTADAGRSRLGKWLEGFAMLSSFPSMSTGATVPFALASARAEVDDHPGVSLRVERYVP